MRTIKRNTGWWLTGIMATGLVPPLLLVGLPGCAARSNMPYWAEVQHVAPDTDTEVQLFKDRSSTRSRRVKGRFLSATADSVTLRLKDGQAETIQKESVHRVRIRRPHQWAKWAALGSPPAIVGTLVATGISTSVIPAFFGVPVFLIPDMKAIYEVPAHDGRKLPQGTSSSPSGVNTPEISK